MSALWEMDSCDAWHAALQQYPEAVAAFGSARLVELDQWRREELPHRITARSRPAITLDELVQLTEWKMLRGVWRPKNLGLVRSNAGAIVEQHSAEALAAVPDPKRPLAVFGKLAGVGPATASALLATAAPETYPFFDEVVGGQIPGLGPVAFTGSYYQQYAAALRERAARLAATCGHGPWPVHHLDLALWAAVGGKKTR